MGLQTGQFRYQPKLRHFLIASLILHFTFVLGVAITQWLMPQKSHFERVELELIDPNTRVADDVQKTKNKKTEIVKNQVVDQNEKALNDETPEDARFLSRNNQVVKKQTIAQERGEFQNKQSKEQKGLEAAKASPEKLRNVDLKPNFDVAKAIEQRTQREADFEKAAKDGTLVVANNQSNKPEQKNQLASQKGGEVSQSLDYIKDLDTGLETLLSTKEFVYYSYFNRIRNQLNQYWSDKVRQKISELYKKGRSIASTDDKITKCLVTLDTTGKLLKIQIIGDSGVRELDEAAVEAFRSAAPFPNPPKGMKDEDGTIKIRWDFILEA